MKICILDMDLEAPGVIFKFPEALDQISTKFGVVDYINHFAKEKKPPDNLDNYFSNALGENKFNIIKIMSAGKGIDTGDYWANLSEINWKELFLDENNKEQSIGEGIIFLEILKKQIERQFNPDYLLIDSRSGVTLMSQICNSILPDVLVMLLASNNENVIGSALMYNHIKSYKFNKGKKIICAITDPAIYKVTL